MKTTDVRVRRAIAAVAAGRPVVVTAEPAQDDDGYLVFAADAATPKLLAFTVRHTSGLVRVALPPSECERLDLPPMCSTAKRAGVGAQRVSVDWKGVGTGISATDRARTIAELAAAASCADDFRRPGHVIPVLADPQGVLGRSAGAEAAFDLARLAGRREAAVLCEIVSRRRPSAMARGAELSDFADEYGLQAISVAELAAYRRRTEPQIVRVADTVMPIRGVNSRVIGFHGVRDGAEHLAVIVGAAGPGVPVALHVHVECITGDVFGASACRCGRDLDGALAQTAASGGGLIVYLRPAGRPRACGLYDDAHEASREQLADMVTWILRDLGVSPLRLSDDAPNVGLVMFGAIPVQRRDVGRTIGSFASAV
ncbi:3,4-dihydroxy-2-butanone-4-phosphate synthase [Mycolicibacterium stellerae]|uniref:3,4-dihydroxy-2-butanone-4-phosphate synthase n=1 Tax=Mycolicibacterium stellerae TaxID=2358193 RepID=UPI000F0B0EEF|nr:3,4-dihydroxy-2-butanone-4-phosphate synthase [Mycolicibacterium stellerae]